VITNRPGLDHITYRIGDYGSARRWLLEQLDRSTPLAAWTYRGADDPGIALYEGAALLIDSLTFYQQAYANEAFLRTATWRESVADLVRLTGYRLAPGVGGTATFAFEVTGDKPVTIPTGVAINAMLAPAPQPADFQTDEEIVAIPGLSRFTLVVTQLPGWITFGSNKLLVARGTPLTFQKNDRLGIGVLSDDGTHLDPFETVIVDSVATWHGRSVLTLKGAISKVGGNRTLTAVKLDKSFHLTGHNSPASYRDSAGNPASVSFTRAFGSDASFGDSYPSQAADELALDPQAPDLALGVRLAIRLSAYELNHYYEPIDPGVVEVMAYHKPPPPQSRFELAKVVDSSAVTVTYGPLSVPSTIVKLDAPLASELDAWFRFDIRSAQIDSVVGDTFTVGAPWTTGFALSTHLVYWGDPADASQLKGRRIGIAPAGKDSFVATVLDVLPADDHALVVLDRSVDLADFPDGNTTPVFGNIADVTQGKHADDAVLGNGDDRVAFQSFQIPSKPLTYLEHPALTPPIQPELQIVVSGRIWKWVPVLFGQPPEAEVYIVREDDDGNSWVQFGDGKTGSRLPSGVDNVVARYRTGSGAYGPMADGAKPSADRTVQQVSAVDLVDVVAGGSAPEDGSTAKVAAPARVQTLDRIVSITDVEAEALEIGGVARAKAVWTIAHGIAAVQVTLLMQPGRTAELDSARSVLATANRERGPQRFPIVVVPGAFEYVYLDLSIAIDPTFDPQPVRDVVTAALDGLLGLASPRTFGDAEYATRIEGVAQNVAGVQWALVNALGSLGVADDPTTLTYPAAPTRAETVPCVGTHVLRLHSVGLRLRNVPGVS
jgi:hypothetical protein